MSETKTFICPNCDGALEFDSKTQKLTCPHCGGTFENDTFNNDNGFDIKNETYSNDAPDYYVCERCGGQIIADEVTAAKSCPYCGSPVVMKGNIAGQYKPKRIIPFKYDRKDAVIRFKKHLEGKVLLPNAFKSQAVFDEIKGIYVPFWTFDGTANARMWFNGERIRTWSDANYNYTETKRYKLFRAGNVSFADVPVDASSKIDDELSQSVEPFDTTDYKEFADTYLAGYFADKYDVDASTASKTANARIANSTESLISSTTTGYSLVTPISSNISIKEGSQEYVMLPMWLLNVNYAGKKYTFAMNGQTGKFVGNLPLDKSKMATIALLTFVGVTIVATLIQYLLYIGG